MGDADNLGGPWEPGTWGYTNNGIAREHARGPCPHRLVVTVADLVREDTGAYISERLPSTTARENVQAVADAFQGDRCGYCGQRYRSAFQESVAGALDRGWPCMY